MDMLLAFDGQLLTGDLVLKDAGLATDAGLQTAVVVSLFTDRRAVEGDRLPVNDGDPRGWWGDLLADQESDQIGSRLWLLEREKQLPEVLVRAEEYAREALQWLIDDGIAETVAVTAETVRTGMLGLAVQIGRPNGETADYRFDRLWEGAADAV